MSYLTKFTRRRTSQREAIPGTAQVPNTAGGFAWAVDDWTRLRRFLILGSEGGSFYAGELTLTRENATAVWRCIESDGPRAIARDRRGQPRRPRGQERPGDLRARDGGLRHRGRDPPGRARRAAAGLPHGHAPVRVRPLRGGVPRLGPLAAPRHRDVVPRTAAGAARLPGGQVPPARRHDATATSCAWRTRSRRRRSTRSCSSGSSAAPRRTACRASSRASPPPQRATDARQTAELVREYGLPREAVQPEHLDSPEVWAALLERDADDGAAAQPRHADPRRRARAGQQRARSTWSRSSATASACARRACTRSRCWPRCAPTPAAAVCAASTRGRRWRRSSTRSTPRSTRRSGTSSRPASACCSRSTCRARWPAAGSPACRA